MTNICRNQVLHTGVHLISADVIILLIGAVNSNELLAFFLFIFKISIDKYRLMYYILITVIITIIDLRTILN